MNDDTGPQIGKLSMRKQKQRVSLRAWLSFVRHARPLPLLLLLAFLNGALYFLLIPPWWHYDEPGQFEYVWLVANRPGWPKIGEYDEAMRMEMAASMQRYGWYDLRNYTPDFSSNTPVWIGVAQAGGQPAYYFAASLPLRVLRGSGITLQYGAVRLVSLLFYLLTILLIWKGLGELLAEGHPLQWLVTGFIALLPAFTDVMLSVTDDVGAILVSCLFLWLSIRLVSRGFSIGRLVPWLMVLPLSYLTKNTAWYALLLAPIVLLLTFLKGRLMWLLWAATPIIILIAALVAFEGGGAAFWYQNGTQTPPLRLQSPTAPLGNYIFQLDYAGGKIAQQTGQLIGQDVVSRLGGKTVTLGAWVWADQPVKARLPCIRFVTDQLSFVDAACPVAQLGPTPCYFRTVIAVPSGADHAMVVPPYISLHGMKIQLFFDAVVLTEGAYPTGTPQFTNSAGSEGIWSGHRFQNLIENSSAEQAALRVRPIVDKWMSGLPTGIGRPSTMFSLAQDWRGASWYYAASFRTLFRTFWASVAADKFNLPGNAPNDVLLSLTAAGILGTFHLLWLKRKVLRWDLVYVLFVTAVLVWGITSVRSVSTILSAYPSYPLSRYAFPAILPSALLICAGWAHWLELLGERYHLSRKALCVVPIVMMGLLSLYTLFNVQRYFHPSLMKREWLFWLAAILVAGFVLLRRRDQLRDSFKQA